MNANQLFADAVLAVHLAFVVFILLGFVTIPVGGWRGWHWVRGFRFRLGHLAAVVFVAGEALAGVACPLTVWEDALRGRGEETSFVARLARRALFYDMPEWVFTVVYLALALGALILWRVVRPSRRRV